MFKKITAFLPYNGNDYTLETVNELSETGYVDKVYLLSKLNSDLDKCDNCEVLKINNLFGSETIKLINKNTAEGFALFLTQDTKIKLGQFALERFVDTAEITGAGIIYSDYYEVKDEERNVHPVIDYQLGSIRDDFNFGPLLILNKEAINRAAQVNSIEYQFSGLYALRLHISMNYPLVRIPEYLYTTVETDLRKTGEKLFDYVNPRNREVQIEMEKAATEYLKKIGAYLPPEFEKIDFTEGSFENEASVIIPVKNRAKTIRDAVESVLRQRTNFPFNLIVVDNHSTDGTTDILKEFARKDKRVLHIIPQRFDLGIGGCWNEAVHHNSCGRFGVQLDSDDIYSDENTVQKIVDLFKKEKCAMVVGTYKLTDFNLTELPPGIIDHKEWTLDNGRNNALRINGLGAPRAFFIPLLRKIKIPNVSYGEDYAIGLTISRRYQIGRIYDVLYLCRRWEDNTDAVLPVEKQNANNLYKDRLRTFEILARQKFISSKVLK